jgi:hypothetical protein
VSPNGHGARNGDALFERALVSEDEAYRLAETRLRESADSAALQRNLTHADPVGRLMANVMLEWSETAGAGADFEKAAQYLDSVERRFARTVAGVPPVRAVVQNLSATFGGRLTEFLALRLVKESQPPPWRALAVLGYLERHGNPATTDAVIRFASRTALPQLQQAAARVLASSGDPALAQKLAAERERLAREGGQLPPVLAALTSPLGGVA